MKVHYTGVNTNKLHDELIAAGVTPLLVESKDNDTWVTYAEDADMVVVGQVVGNHSPIPNPPPKTEVERLREQLAQQASDFMGFMEYYFTLHPEDA